MGFLKGIGLFLAALMVLALVLGIALFIFTLAWMLRIVFLVLAVVIVIMYALSELFGGFRRKRRSS